jgi:hypothetical protein
MIPLTNSSVTEHWRITENTIGGLAIFFIGNAPNVHCGSIYKKCEKNSNIEAMLRSFLCPAQGVLKKDPTVWLDGARPLHMYLILAI